MRITYKVLVHFLPSRAFISFPGRVLNLSRTILVTLRSQNLPFNLSVLTPSSLRRLFPSRNILRPNTLTVALFPYLRHEPYTVSLSSVHVPMASTSLRAGAESMIHGFFTTLRNTWRKVVALLTYPLDLVRNECRYKRDELERVRNERAEVLGALADLREQLISALEEPSNEEGLTRLAFFATQLQLIVRSEFVAAKQPPALPLSSQDVLQPLYAFAYTTLPAHISFHVQHLNAHGLIRPSRLTLIWPKLVFLPPLALYAVRSAYTSRASLEEMAREAAETVKGFWEGWLLAPLKDIVKTVRATDEDGVIVTRESVKADLDSLERMTLALAREKLHYNPEQLAALTKQIRLGDLTPVMQIYEDDIRSPLKSVVGGTLLRTLFVQIQKAKVDIDQALSGIDKLLKSQELTFAFVGVAPALAIVYMSGSYLHALYAGGRGSGRYGGKKRRTRVWLAMRSIERLLIALPKSKHDHTPSSPADQPPSSSIPPLTSGLLLLSLTYLRSYATTYLPQNSRLREGFLDDVSDLENPALGRGEKMRIVDRMWKSWGDVLGWRRIAASESLV
ncbi:unnamed protein product [Somion occarium]|uniref:NCA2-domain-containing protein n=1 Tax=Somion occarium TaxID=3059160 RepID=A0ABP1DYM0_9APHY